MEQDSGEDLLGDSDVNRFPVAFSALFFGFGIAAGFLLAFSGLGFLQDSAGVIAGIFLVALSLVALLGLILWLLRDRILARVFGVAESQVAVLAGPLAEVVLGAARRDPEQAALSVRRLVQVALARYTWIATRRWILTALTALIAAMAALAGTALLFKQNDLLGQQNDLLSQQITLLAEQNLGIVQQAELVRQQTALLAQDLELAEASRNAGLAAELTGITAALAASVERARPDDGTAPGIADIVPVLDPVADLDRSLIFRIIAVSQTLRPYRFLDNGFDETDDDDLMRHAMAARRDTVPGVWERMATDYGWSVPVEHHDLIDRPASPERGQLLRLLLGNGIQAFDVFNFYHFDLSFAHAHGLALYNASMPVALLPYADFSYSNVVDSDLTGAQLSNARFRHASMRRVGLGSMPGTEAPPPFATGDSTIYVTRLNGADFTGAMLQEVDFSGANALASIFDRALLLSPDFRDTALGAASFRGAVIVAPQWQGAWLRSVDFDGALVFGADPLAEIAAAVAPGSFVAARYRAEPAELEAALARFNWPQADAAAIRALTGGAAPWRLVRLAGFD